ncbi:hypothetical protein [Rhodobacteraceae phage LS06-2018-MD06]|jgi:hypothetical protein|nr:hypothetical protein [Rhodobacteraceae phage LS06-2018-MD06]
MSSSSLKDKSEEMMVSADMIAEGLELPTKTYNSVLRYVDPDAATERSIREKILRLQRPTSSPHRLVWHARAVCLQYFLDRGEFAGRNKSISERLHRIYFG